jgi:amino acid adenylation domain-containing protein
MPGCRPTIAAPLTAIDAPRPWPARPAGRMRRILLNAFAITGGNGVLVLEEAPAAPSARPAPAMRRLAPRRYWPTAVDPSAPPVIEATAADRAAVLCRILAAVLHLKAEEVDLGLSPAEAGIESLLALELHHRLRRDAGLELGVNEILGAARLGDLVGLSVQEDPSAVPIHAVAGDPEAPFPLTDIQAAYLVGRDAAMTLGGTGCHVHWMFDRADELDVERLEAGWNRLVALHPMLRAVFDQDGRQRVLAEVPACRIERHDLRGAPQAAKDELRRRLGQRAFDPGTWPLFHLAISRDEAGTRLHVGIDLLIIDVQSLYGLLGAWGRLYHDPTLSLPAPKLTFRQCVHAFEAMRQTPGWAASEAYWEKAAATLPPAPRLPLQREPARGERLTTRRHEARLAPGTWRRIGGLARRHRVSPAAAALTAFAAALTHWATEPRFTLNLTTSLRQALGPDAAEVVGDFTGTLLLDVDCAGSGSFAARAAAVGARLAAHLSHAQVSGIRTLRRVAALRGVEAALMPVVFTSMLGYGQPAGPDPDDPRPITALGRFAGGATQTPQVWLDAQIQEDGGEAILSWDVAEGLFAEPLSMAMFAAWVRAVADLAEEDGWARDPIAAIEVREQAPRDVANGQARELPAGPLFGPFLARAEAAPERLAVIAGDGSLTYAALRQRATALAGRLQSAGAAPETLIAVAMDRGWRQIVAVLAVQMSGAAYLPLDPHLPAARFRLLVERGEVRIGITESGRSLPWLDGTTIVEVGEAPDPADMPAMPVGLPGPESLAYVIFTSGSTGEPKGVMIEHRAALNTCLDINERLALGPEDRVLALSALTFDLSVWDIFGTLAAGAAMVLPAPRSFADPAHLAELCRTHGVTVWNSVPMFMELFLAGEPAADAIAALRAVMLSGDWIPLGLPGRVRAMQPKAKVHSLGGATEASIWSIHHPIEAEPRPGWSSVPYGRPLANQTFQVLDEVLGACPDGFPGELHIGGAGLARGYWHDAARTDAAFIRHPATGERLYRTGDLGRWREDGLIEFLGRRDGQVKIDGFRVELGEIEAALRRLPGIEEAVAVAPADAHGRRLLVAFVVGAGVDGAEATLAELRRQLPAYMVPRRIERLASLPLSANQKVDRAALARLALGERHPAQSAPATVAPATALEGMPLAPAIQRIWQVVLDEAGRRPAGSGPPPLDRNLFEFGADSLMAVVASRRIGRDLGLRCAVTDVFEHPTIAALAIFLARQRVGHRPEPSPRPLPLPLPPAELPRLPAMAAGLDRAAARRGFRMALGR